MVHLRSLTVRGYKSIRELEAFELRPLNVLIGANGAGKSNFLSLFEMLAALVDQRLQLYVQQNDGPDALLFGSRKRTAEIDMDLVFGPNGYHVTLVPTGDRLVFAHEETRFEEYIKTERRFLGGGHEESRLPHVDDDVLARIVRPAIKSWRVYHFHDTSVTAPVRQAQPVRDNLRLKPDAGNLAPFLRRLRGRHPEHYERILRTVRMIAPFFRDLVYREEPGERVELEWLENDDPDTPRGPRQMSDGTLRFMCLATLLLQPSDLQPGIIVIDEPELGLHPYALSVLAGLLRQAAGQRQTIVSTQSADLLDEFQPEDVVVVSRRDGSSIFDRLDVDQLQLWLEDYSLSELWHANVIGGRP